MEASIMTEHGIRHNTGIIIKSFRSSNIKYKIVSRGSFKSIYEKIKIILTVRLVEVHVPLPPSLLSLWNRYGIENCVVLFLVDRCVGDLIPGDYFRYAGFRPIQLDRFDCDDSGLALVDRIGSIPKK